MVSVHFVLTRRLFVKLKNIHQRETRKASVVTLLDMQERYDNLDLDLECEGGGGGGVAVSICLEAN